MLQLINISKSFKSTENNKVISVLSSISMEAEQGEIISIFGPNGSGKSTLLKILAGIIKPETGEINLGSIKTKIGYVWQNYSESLFPWYSVKKNIEFPYTLTRAQNSLCDDDIALKTLKELDFDIRLDAFPYQISGGQQQMVAIARALSNKPSILILDEPFSALDKKNRDLALIGLHKYHEKTKPIIVFVSHSLDEAILFCNKLVLISDIPGKIIGTINIDFQEKRNNTLLTSNQFINYRNMALEIINEEITI